MTTDQPASPADAPSGEGKRRRVPTIELSATEIEGPAADAAGEAPPPAEADSTDAQSKDAEKPSPQPAAAYRPWAAVGAGAAAGATISLLFVAASFLIPRDGGSPPTEAASANRLSAVESDIKALTATVAGLARRSDEAATAAREARQRADATAAALAELRQKVVAPGAADLAARDKIEGELQSLATRFAAVERAEKTLETELGKRVEAQNRDRSGRLAVAAMALSAAVEQGRPFTAELAAATSLAADPKQLAPLEPFAASGVPTAPALARELSALMPSLLAAAGPTPRDGSFLEKLQANAEKLVHIRPLAEAPGSDPAAVVARAGVKASKGDLAGALAELADLPPAARAPAGAWMEKAQARSAAVEASRQLAANAFAELSK
jgi:hypothetical protein